MKYIEIWWDNKPFRGLDNDRFTFNDLEEAFDEIYPLVLKRYNEGRKLSLKRISFVMKCKKWNWKLSWYLVKDLAFDLSWLRKHRQINKELKEPVMS